MPIVALAAALAVGAPTAGAEGSAVPEMCNGSIAPSTLVNAQAHGSNKFILNVATDPAGVASGVMIIGQRSSRVYVDQICRVWVHIPGQVPGGGHDGHEGDDGASTAHAVGVGFLADGTPVLVRADVRETDEGSFFRARYRVMSGHGGHVLSVGVFESDGTDDEGEWVRVPAEGWAPLHQLNLRPA